MEKLLTDNCKNFSDKIFSQNGNMTFYTAEFTNKQSKLPKTLLSCVRYLSKINDIEQDLTGVNFGFQGVILNEELSDKKVCRIASELAAAIDENSVQKIKKLKNKYVNDKEFLIAKKFLDKKCKEIWNILNSNEILKIPTESMQCLGITNQPPLESLLENSVLYYEKNNGNSTANIIRSILNNKNMNYSIKEIHTYLKTMAEKENCRYNSNTVRYLITGQNYTFAMLNDLCISKAEIKKVYKNLPLILKIKFIIKNIKFSH